MALRFKKDAKRALRLKKGLDIIRLKTKPQARPGRYNT